MKLLKKTDNDNVVLLCNRAIALILDMIPRSCHVVVAGGVVPLLIKFLKVSGMLIMYVRVDFSWQFIRAFPPFNVACLECNVGG